MDQVNGMNLNRLDYPNRVSQIEDIGYVAIPLTLCALRVILSVFLVYRVCNTHIHAYIYIHKQRIIICNNIGETENEVKRNRTGSL